MGSSSIGSSHDCAFLLVVAIFLSYRLNAAVVGKFK